MVTSKRPQITRALTLTDFTSWYWLKADLVLLCRCFNLGTTSTKLELEDKLRSHLSGKASKVVLRRRVAGEMPSVFTPETVIGTGWRCNPALGSYFREVVGSGFCSNAAMREFIYNSVGRTLADAVDCFQASTLSGAPKPLIPPQLEYNQHFRNFFAAHPGATRSRLSPPGGRSVQDVTEHNRESMNACIKRAP